MTTPEPGDVVISGVSQRFGHGTRQVVALDDVDVVAPAGKTTTIVGPSGCGKSTLLDLVAGLTTPVSGEVRIGGQAVRGTQDGVAMAFQQPALMPWLNVRDNIALGLRGRGTPKAQAYEQIAGLIEMMTLEGFEGSYPHELSGGMAQRVGIARALAMRPSVLLMDEPFASVDAYTRVRLQEELLGLLERRASTVLFVTHDVDEAVYLGDKVVVMSPRPGRVVETTELGPECRDRSSSTHASTVSEIRDRLFACSQAVAIAGGTAQI